MLLLNYLPFLCKSVLLLSNKQINKQLKREIVTKINKKLFSKGALLLSYKQINKQLKREIVTPIKFNIAKVF